MPERASNPEAHVKAYPPNPHRGRLNGSVRVRAMSALSPMRTRQAGNFFLSPASPEVGETQLVKAAIDMFDQVARLHSLTSSLKSE